MLDLWLDQAHFQAYLASAHFAGRKTMPRAIYRSFRVIIITADNRIGRLQQQRSKHEYVAKDEKDATSQLKRHYARIRRGHQYFWIETFVETTHEASPQPIEIPPEIVQIRPPDPDSPTLPAA